MFCFQKQAEGVPTLILGVWGMLTHLVICTTSIAEETPSHLCR